MTAPAFTPRPDPPPRADGRCVVCRKRRTHAVPSRYSGDQAVRDPYCSASCAKAFHGVSARTGELAKADAA